MRIRRRAKGLASWDVHVTIVFEDYRVGETTSGLITCCNYEGKTLCISYGAVIVSVQV